MRKVATESFFSLNHIIQHIIISICLKSLYLLGALLSFLAFPFMFWKGATLQKILLSHTPFFSLRKFLFSSVLGTSFLLLFKHFFWNILLHYKLFLIRYLYHIRCGTWKIHNPKTLVRKVAKKWILYLSSLPLQLHFSLGW